MGCILWGGGGAGVGAGGSIGVQAGGSNAKTVCDLRGPFVSASGSGGAGLVGGGEGYAGKDSDGNTVMGGNGFVGAGEGASGTVGATYTWVRKF